MTQGRSAGLAGRNRILTYDHWRMCSSIRSSAIEVFQERIWVGIVGAKKISQSEGFAQFSHSGFSEKRGSDPMMWAPVVMRSSWKVPTTDGKKWFKTPSMRCNVVVSTAKDDCMVGGKDILSSAKWRKVVIAEHLKQKKIYLWLFCFYVEGDRGGF